MPISCGSTREDRCPPSADRGSGCASSSAARAGTSTPNPNTARPRRRRPGPGRRGRGGGDDGGCGRPGAGRTPPTCPPGDGGPTSAGHSPPGRQDLPALDVRHPDPAVLWAGHRRGGPVDPGSYDYRRAALDALHFPKLVDRFWQNLRRCAGYRGAVLRHRRGPTPPRPAPARRDAGHDPPPGRARGPGRHLPPTLVARRTTRRCLPSSSRAGAEDGGYVDPDAGSVLPTWDEALDVVDSDPDGEPAACGAVRGPGRHAGPAGRDTGRRPAIGYLCKYLTKDIATTYDDGEPSPRPGAPHRPAGRGGPLAALLPHVCELAAIRDPAQGPVPGMVPGQCKHKAHDRANLGLGGRRVLVSRKWSGKTLAGHKADRAAVVRAALEEAGIDPDDHDELSITGTDGRWSWELLGRTRVDEHTYAAAVAERSPPASGGGPSTRPPRQPERGAGRAARRRLSSAIRQRPGRESRTRGDGHPVDCAGSGRAVGNVGGVPSPADP